MNKKTNNKHHAPLPILPAPQQISPVPNNSDIISRSSNGNIPILPNYIPDLRKKVSHPPHNCFPPRQNKRKLSSIGFMNNNHSFSKEGNKSRDESLHLSLYFSQCATDKIKDSNIRFPRTSTLIKDFNTDSFFNEILL